MPIYTRSGPSRSGEEVVNMLVRLSGTNFRSFKNTFELSAIAADLDGEGDGDRGVYEAKIAGSDEPLRLLRVLAIYGPNASGKSSVLDAARVLSWMIGESIRMDRSDTDPGEIFEYAPFALNVDSARADTQLSCDVLHDDHILRYEVSYNQYEITRESLVLYAGDTERVLITRESAGEVAGQLIELSEANKLYVKAMAKNVSVVAKLARFGPTEGADAMSPYRDSLLRSLKWRSFVSSAGNVPYRFTGSGRGVLRSPAAMQFAENSVYQKWVMKNVMTAADLGIKNVHVEKVEREIAEPRELSDKDAPRRSLPLGVVVAFVHTGDREMPFEFSEESSGTMKLFSLSDHLWRLSQEGGTLFADELGASLHPTLLDRIVRDVNDTDNKAHASQLIFTSHELGLMEGLGEQVPALRRDQIFFCEKNAKGESELFNLTEFKGDARTVHNIRKRYLTGLYGALPLVQRMRL
jgi:hypothetical protein